jgi:hypothetical protein
MRKLFYLLLFASTLVTTVSSCKKDKKTGPAVPPAGAVQIWSNVHIVDSTQWILFVNSVHPANGVYMYSFTPTTPNINVQIGDILLGTANGGYIRKVTATSVNGGYYYIQTQQATMADVFKTGTFSFQVPINDSSQLSPGVTNTFSNFALYHTSNFEINLLSGQFNVQPSLNFNFSFDSLGLTNFQMATSNTPLSDNIKVGVKGEMPHQWVQDVVLANYTVNVIQQIQAWTPNGNVMVPIVIKLKLSLLANANGGGVSDTMSTIVNWSSNDVYSAGLQYQSGTWQPLQNSVATNVVAFDTFSQATDLSANVSFLTQINSSFYTIAGPQLTIGFSGNLQEVNRGGPTAPFLRRTLGWNSLTDMQTSYPIFGRNIGAFNQTWTSDSVLYQAPYQATKISGDNQTANVVSTLPQPLVLKITDSNGQAVSGLPLTFSVTHGGGTLSAYNLFTDQNGLVQVTWTLGPPMGNQNVTVKVVDGLNLPLVGSPVIFNATGD